MKTFQKTLLLIFLPFFGFGQEGYLIRYESFIENYDSLVSYIHFPDELELKINGDASQLTEYKKHYTTTEFHDKKTGKFYTMFNRDSYHETSKFPDFPFIKTEEERELFGLKIQKYLLPWFNRDTLVYWITEDLGLSEKKLWSGAPGIPLQYEVSNEDRKYTVVAKLVKRMSAPIEIPDFSKMQTGITLSEEEMKLAQMEVLNKKKKLEYHFRELKLKTLDGKKISGKELKGKTVVLMINNAAFSLGNVATEKMNKLVEQYEDREEVVFLSIVGASRLRAKKMSCGCLKYQVCPNGAKFAKKIGVQHYQTLHAVISPEGKATVFTKAYASLRRDIANAIDGKEVKSY